VWLVAKVKNRRQSVKKEAFSSFLSKKLVMVSIRKFRIIVLVSNRILQLTIRFDSKFRIFAQHYWPVTLGMSLVFLYETAINFMMGKPDVIQQLPLGEW